MNKITSLRAQIEYQRSIGCNKTADLLADDLAAQLVLIPQSWIDSSTEEESQ
jgi:hypothetical protein